MNGYLTASVYHESFYENKVFVQYQDNPYQQKWSTYFIPAQTTDRFETSRQSPGSLYCLVTVCVDRTTSTCAYIEADVQLSTSASLSLQYQNKDREVHGGLPNYGLC